MAEWFLSTEPDDFRLINLDTGTELCLQRITGAQPEWQLIIRVRDMPQFLKTFPSYEEAMKAWKKIHEDLEKGKKILSWL